MYPVIGVIVEAEFVIVSQTGSLVPGCLESPVFGPHMGEVAARFFRLIGPYDLMRISEG
jgi:hypothetical protein